jgi:hypothetical protein
LTVTTTPQLIDQLAGDLRAMPHGLVARRIGLGVLLGAAITAAIVQLLWGVRPGFAAALTSSPFWLKLAYPGALALLGIAATLRLARPDGHVTRSTWRSLALVLIVMVGLAAAELSRVAPDAYSQLVMGSTAATCPWLIALLALPVMAITFSVLRRMAPTNLMLAGAASGLTAGATAAFIYAFSCDESALPFVLIWYGLGMAVPTAVGALLGRFALRW